MSIKDNIKVLKNKIFFYPDGIYEYPTPIWIAETKVLDNKMDGNYFNSYIIDVASEKIIDIIAS